MSEMNIPPYYKVSGMMMNMIAEILQPLNAVGVMDGLAGTRWRRQEYEETA